jgi:mono/diheme cytochrome c family protein
MINKSINYWGVFIGSLVFLTLCACKDNKQTNIINPNEELLKRGKLIYLTRCTVCHNNDPKIPGSVGPEIYGSSKDLIEHRVLTAKYPDNYKPKRNSKLMPPMPDLKNDIEALHYFLNHE